MTRKNRIRLALFCFPLVLAGCSNGFPNSKTTTSYTLSVNPPSAIVAAGSTATFAAVFAPSVPPGGSLTWSVNPSSGGSITTTGVFTASGTAGNYTVIATWTPSLGASGSIITGSAAVQVLPPVQLGSELNINLVQASGGVQVSNTVQNSAVLGQHLPYVSATDAGSNVQVNHGFSIPVACTGSNTNCP